MQENSNGKDNVKVVIRVRPLNGDEQAFHDSKCVVVTDNNSISIDSKPEPKIFAYDYVVDEDEPQELVFRNVARPIVD